MNASIEQDIRATVENFIENAASATLPTKLPSTCASGNHVANGNDGSFISRTSEKSSTDTKNNEEDCCDDKDPSDEEPVEPDDRADKGDSIAETDDTAVDQKQRELWRR